MTDQFSGIESLLGIKQGSTAQIDPNDVGKVQKVLTKAVEKKTKEMEKELKKVDTLSTLPNADLVKCGLSIQSLEEDKVTLRKEAFEVYRICRTLLNKYMEDVEGQIDTSHLMYKAGFDGITSASNSLKTLTEMVMRFKQEEEIKNIPLENENGNGNTKEMSPQDWINFIDEVKVSETEVNAVDAEIVEEENE